MHGLLFAISNRWATGAQTTSSPGMPMWMNLLPIVAILAIFYFILIRPQQKRQKEHMNMIGALRKGDRVVTNAGIYGTIADVKESIIVLKIADDVKIELMKSAVAAVLNGKGE